MPMLGPIIYMDKSNHAKVQGFLIIKSTQYIICPSLLTVYVKFIIMIFDTCPSKI